MSKPKCIGSIVLPTISLILSDHTLHLGKFNALMSPLVTCVHTALIYVHVDTQVFSMDHLTLASLQALSLHLSQLADDTCAKVKE